MSRIPPRLLSDLFRYQHTSHHWVRILIQLHSRLDLIEICTLVLQTFVHDPLYLLEEIALQGAKRVPIILTGQFPCLSINALWFSQWPVLGPHGVRQDRQGELVCCLEAVDIGHKACPDY